MPESRARDGWDAYLGWYHADRPGITEDAFSHARDVDGGDPYDWLVSSLPATVGRVLDLGCGTSPVQPRMTTATAYLGVDLSVDELRVGRALGRGPTAVGDARSLPATDAEFDCVVSSMSLMLVRPVADGLAEVARVLRPGGTFAVLLPSAGPIGVADLGVVLSLAVALRGPGSMPQRLTRRRLDRLAGEAGLELVSAEARRFALPLETPIDAALAVSMLYTPGMDRRRLDRAQDRLGRRSAPGRSLPVPLLRAVLRRR